MPRIGIFGGSFNPIHIAHLVVADRFVEHLGLESCYFVPAAHPPLKPSANSELAPAEHRLAMVQLATREHPRFCTEACEIRRGGISYTVDTIAEFQQRFPTAELFLLLGADQAIEFHLWHRWREIVQQVRLCIAPRPGVDDFELRQHLMTLGLSEAIILEVPLLAVSSTNIRSRLARGLSVRYIVPDTVLDYIYAHRLYVAP